MQAGTTREYTLAILKNLELWFSPASRFNDPFDCHLDIAVQSSKEVTALVDRGVERARMALWGRFYDAQETLRKRAEEQGKTLPALIGPPQARIEPRPPSKLTMRRQDASGKWRRVSVGKAYTGFLEGDLDAMYQVLDSSFGVLCLSERPDDILLWSHYGNSHDGLCLEFDARNYPAAFPRLCPVVYQREYPKIPAMFPQFLRALRDKNEGLIQESLLDLVHHLAADLKAEPEERPAEEMGAIAMAMWFYVKSSFWKYEREWRCLKWKPGNLAFPAQALTRIIVGCVNTEPNLTLVKEAVGGTPLEGTPIIKAVRKRRKFGLDLVPI